LREPDSGAQQLLEKELKASGIADAATRSAALRAGGHLEVARAIAMNAADVGVATRDAAITLGLRFLPLTEERYDLVLRKEHASDPRIARFFDGLATREVRIELDALGYDLSAAGAHVADVGG
jgi:molybdate-binding protein